MPNQVQINHGQLVELIVVKNSFIPCSFLVQNIDDNTVFVIFDLNKQHLTIASCPSAMTEHEINTVFRFFSSGGSYKAALINGKKPSDVAEILRKKFSELKVVPQQKHSFNNFYYSTNLSLFDKDAPMDFADQNPAFDFDILKPGKQWPSGQEWPEYLYCYEDIPVDEDNWCGLHIPKSVTSTSSVPHTTSTSTSTAKVVADDENDLDVYHVNLGQTAVIHLSDTRVVRCNLSNKAVAFAVCDETTNTLAISVMGNLVSKGFAENAVKQCWANILETLVRRNAEIKEHNGKHPKDQITLKKGGRYYQIFAPPGTNSETTDHLDAAVSNRDSSIGVNSEFKAKEGGFGGTKASPHHCSFSEFLMEIKKDSGFTVTNFAQSALLPQRYRKKPLNLSAIALKKLELMEDTNPDKKCFQDLKYVQDTPLNIELTSGAILELDISENRCFIEIQEKTIVMYRFYEHTGKLAVLQIPTKYFNDALAIKYLSNGHFEVLSKFADAPKSKGAPIASYFLECKAPSIGHKEASDACDNYIKYFATNYKTFSDAHFSNELELHTLASPEKISFKLKDEKKKNYLSFWLEGGKLKTIVDSTLQDKGVNSIGKPMEATKSPKSPESKDPIDWPAFYQSLGVTATVKEFSNNERWTPPHGANTTTTTTSKVVSKSQ